jgi:Co/Zn/Cd efflux system component
LTLGFAVVEVVTGFMSNSLALISDAGHMVHHERPEFLARAIEAFLERYGA